MKMTVLLVLLGLSLRNEMYAEQSMASQLVFTNRCLAELSDSEKHEYLDLIGGDEIRFPIPRSPSGIAPWAHTEHQFGFLPFTRDMNPQQFIPAHAVQPNTNLHRIDVKLDRIRVFHYPGKGRHFVLFTFGAQNSPTNVQTSAEGLTFSQTYEVQDDEGAGITGYPVFIGLNVGKVGAAFKCATVNVKNARDENALAFLKSGPVSQGLTLLTTAYPAIAPFTELAKGLGQMLLTRNENIKVQDFYLGLDFDSGAAFGARLQEGNYVVVQAPDTEFSWDDWIYNPQDGRILRRGSSNLTMPFNYIIFRVTKHQD